ncbi:alpha/beta hydrolase [Micromonospora sp. NPDC006766]|uniref:alpha/beta fold hydrolase n=1 Tax=Micromonospora sp. NPDC006766 TaxID=3154778 RepID=UPI003408832A
MVAMLASIRRPERVSSLALIEPAALAVTADHPTVAAALEANRRYVAASQSTTAEDYLRASYGAGDERVPEPREFALRAARTAMRERPCWEADVPVNALRPTSYPKMVLAGTWETAPADYRSTTGDALVATAGVIAERIDARFHQIAGADHAPHQQRPDEVNRLLLDLWEQAADRAAPGAGA